MKKIKIKLKLDAKKFREKLNIKDGKDYVLTKKDLRVIADMIEVPVVEQKIITEVPIVKEVAVVDTTEQIRDKLEGLKKGEKLTIQAIEDLADILAELQKKGRDLGLLKGSIHAGKGREIRFIDDETPSGTINGVNTSFTTAKTFLRGTLKVYRNGARMRVTEDYTLSGKVITFLIAPQVGEIILCDYRY